MIDNSYFLDELKQLLSEEKYNLFLDVLDKPMVIALALIIYGIIFIIVESCHITQSMNTLEDIDYITAANIGLFQMLALIPGTSRSG